LVAIVNYKTGALVVECLRSLQEQIAQLPGSRVAIADNDSQDGSAEFIARQIEENGWQSWASVLPISTNGGFAAGNNALIEPALRSADPPSFVLLLNPDTTVLEGALLNLVAFMQVRQDIGILGGHQEHPNGTPLRSAFRFVNPLGELDGALRLGIVSNLLRRWEHAPEIPKQAVRTDWVSGGCMLVRREVLEKVGLMDDAYFLYYEEMDYCLQAKRAGWDTWFLPSSKIVHVGGQSTGVTGLTRRPNRRPGYWFDSRRRYYLKNFGPGHALAADIFHLVGFSLWRARRAVQGKPDDDPPSFLGDLWANSVFVRGFGLNDTGRAADSKHGTGRVG
jgi:N-acetylglucosaminyl-diphospho-decaprenol L-rhamnosyltransferase